MPSPHGRRSATRARWAARGLAAASWIALVASAVQASHAEHVADWSYDVPRAGAYAAAALVTRLVYQRIQSRWQMLGFAIAASTLDLLYPALAGIGPAISTWLAGLAGTGLGVVLGRVIAHSAWTYKYGAIRRPSPLRNAPVKSLDLK